MSKQITDTIMMVRPAHFGFNPETAKNNAFQTNDTSLSPTEISKKAKGEFDQFVNQLRINGIEVLVWNDTETPIKPDAVFPNNWVSFHKDGTVITYPIYAQVRRIERSEEIIQFVGENRLIEKRVHLEDNEPDDKFLEGTGSIIMDRVNNIAYACLSPRTNDELFDVFCKKVGAKKVIFTATDNNGVDIYHTNVMMALGVDFVVICMESIKDDTEKAHLIALFEQTGKTIIEISIEQMNAFAGNMLQVKNQMEETFLVMSQQAYQSLSQTQIDLIESKTEIIYSPIDTIERYGGGSARCMMAEVFLPKLD